MGFKLGISVPTSCRIHKTWRNQKGSRDFFKENYWDNAFPNNNKLEYIELPHCVDPQRYNSRGSDTAAPKFVHVAKMRDIYKYSFYPRTSVEWNSIPPEIRKAKGANSFKVGCTKVVSV